MGNLPSSLMVKTLTSNAGGMCLISGWRAKTPHVSWPNTKRQNRNNVVNKFNKDCKTGPHTHTQILKKKKKKRFLENSCFKGRTKRLIETFLVVWWLRLHAANAGGPSLIPGQAARSCMEQLRTSAAKQINFKKIETLKNDCTTQQMMLLLCF